MFYTPNKEAHTRDFMVSMGLGQEVPEGQLTFEMSQLGSFELCKAVKDYYPMIISVNYQETDGVQYAMMTYCTFQKDGDGTINGVHVVKQVVLVSITKKTFMQHAKDASISKCR